jgi:hypothetical protein
MLLDPKTQMANITDSSKRIQSLVFTLPSEFGYPPIQFLDSCSMAGNLKTEVLSCRLDRVSGQTRVTIIPDSAYDNSLKIIRISHSNTSLLYDPPTYPGSHYKISNFLYNISGGLKESNTINVEQILGYVIDDATIEYKYGEY